MWKFIAELYDKYEKLVETDENYYLEVCTLGDNFLTYSLLYFITINLGDRAFVIE